MDIQGKAVLVTGASSGIGVEGRPRARFVLAVMHQHMRASLREGDRNGLAAIFIAENDVLVGQVLTLDGGTSLVGMP
jgi:hypothetical protein